MDNISVSPNAVQASKTCISFIHVKNLDVQEVLWELETIWGSSLSFELHYLLFSQFENRKNQHNEYLQTK